MTLQAIGDVALGVLALGLLAHSWHMTARVEWLEGCVGELQRKVFPLEAGEGGPDA